MIVRVRLNENGALTEIDWKPTDRAARALLAYVEEASLDERERFGYDVKIVPLIKSVLDRTIEVPFPNLKRPYNARSQNEGWEPTPPEEFQDRYSLLMFRITGAPAAFSLSTHESGRYVFGKYREEDHDGTLWEVCWFED